MIKLSLRGRWPGIAWSSLCCSEVMEVEEMAEMKGCFSLKLMLVWCLVMSFSGVTTQVHGQPTGSVGFMSIDCGIPGNYSYIDNTTQIPYTSDAQFIDTGTNHNISMEGTALLSMQDASLRSFPSGIRNCYTLKPIIQDKKYLIRASFLYGNYDGLNKTLAVEPILFDLHLGVNLWKTINISDASTVYRAEVIAVAPSDFISVCLINTGRGTPFISSLELRPLKDILYPAVNISQPLVLFMRLNMGPKKNDIVRYPDDRYDRIWIPYGGVRGWATISTTSTVQNIMNDLFEAPTAVMQTAVTSAISSSLSLAWDPTVQDNSLVYYAILHISEIQSLAFQGNNSRQFNILFNEVKFYGPYRPEYLYSDAVYTTSPLRGDQRQNLTLSATSNSTLPPILNALEVYSIMPLSDAATDSGDVDAIMAIKAWYRIKRNWVGDPCSPIAFAWDGLNCTYSISDPPRISTLNLSSSGLTGEIATSLAKLQTIQYLDLSYNNLTGTIPDLLAELSSLKFLDLTGNQLTGSIPSGLIRRSQSGSLTLRVDPNLCANGNSCEVNVMKKKKIATPIVVILSIAPVVLLVLIFILCRMRRRKDLASSTAVRPQVKEHDNDPLQLENRQFTYKELEVITNNFERVLGQGGFGTVYHGYLENGSQVAVKMLSQSSSQGAKEFLAEAQNLARVHHRNLVSLVGYCRDGNYLALVYEYMPQGTLQEHLRGKDCKARALSWGERLRIAIDAAQGLEYLHKGCKPPLIHRDVKTGNILLSQRLEAKIADFGLSKVFHSDVQSHVSTAVVGTPGYLDPEYYNTFQLSEKSDVYSFGVVLLELITGRPPIISGPENCNIIHWVRQRLAKGNIEAAIDARMKGEYDVNSVWKAADVALNCTEQTSMQRPTMADVVMQLKEGLALEAARERSMNSNLFTCSENLHTESSDASRNSIFQMEHVGEISVVSGPAAR